MALVEVSFQPAGKVVFVQPGTTLLAAAGMAGLDVLSGCTRGMCGTDAVQVHGGAGDLDPPTDAEGGTLSRMGVGGGFRLACSARVRSGRIEVILGAF